MFLAALRDLILTQNVEDGGAMELLMTTNEPAGAYPTGGTIFWADSDPGSTWEDHPTATPAIKASGQTETDDSSVVSDVRVRSALVGVRIGPASTSYGEAAIDAAATAAPDLDCAPLEHRPARRPNWRDRADEPRQGDVCEECRQQTWWSDHTVRPGWNCEACFDPQHQRSSDFTLVKTGVSGMREET